MIKKIKNKNKKRNIYGIGFEYGANTLVNYGAS